MCALNETGRDEVYVQAYPAPGQKALISTGGGTNPVWRHDGRELYYWVGDELIAARLDATGAGPSLVVRDRTPLFRAPYLANINPNYDVSPDGTRFIVVTGRTPPNQLVIALHALDGAGHGDHR